MDNTHTTNIYIYVYIYIHTTYLHEILILCPVIFLWIVLRQTLRSARRTAVERLGEWWFKGANKNMGTYWN